MTRVEIVLAACWCGLGWFLCGLYAVLGLRFTWVAVVGGLCAVTIHELHKVWITERRP